MGKRNRENPIANIGFILLLAISVMFTCGNVFAYDEDAGDDDQSQIDLARSMAQKRDKSPIIDLKQKIDAQRPKPVLPEGKTLIREVKVSGSTIIAKAALGKLIAVNTDKELTGKDIQKIADKITRAYSRHGYITSYAYVVPEKLSEGVLDIQVVEGRTGNIEIKGNRYFSTELLRKKISLKEGQIFNFRKLSIDVYKINRHMDRKAAIQVDAGANPGFTDIVMTVKDKSPLHVTLQVDDYGAETILYNRYKIFLFHNNISGHDDTLTAKLEWADGDSHKIGDFDYSVPLNNTWRFQFYLMPYKSEDYYYIDNKDTDFEKRARKFYFWFYQSLVNQPDMEFTSSYGFTYMDIFWYKPYVNYNTPVRMDRFRVLKWDLAFNRADKYGRWVFTNDLQKAIPRIFGGSHIKSDANSVVGAKGNFVKNMLTVARRQKLGYGVDFLAKARWQISSATLTGVNDFSAGGYCGVIDNRGFPRTQAPADGGRSLNLGFNFPAYFIPKNVNVPFSTTKFYNALTFFTFWDYSQSILKSPKLATVAGKPNDKKITTLRSVGLGLTFTVPDQNLSIRVETGFPLSSQTPKDGDHTHTWWSVTKTY